MVKIVEKIKLYLKRWNINPSTVLFVFISLIPLIAWYSPGTIYGRGDVLPFWINQNYAPSFYLWDPGSLGAPNNRPVSLVYLGFDWLFRSVLHMEVGFSQMFFYSLYVLTSLYFFRAFYKLYFKSEKNEDSFGSVAGAIFYTFNVFILERSFYPSIRWVTVALPVLGYFTLKLLRAERNLKDSVILALVAAICFSLVIINPPLVLILIIFLIFLLISENFKGLKKIPLPVLIAAPALAWVFIAAYFYIFVGVDLNTETDPAKWIWTALNANFLNIFLLKVSWAFQSQYYLFAEYFNSRGYLFPFFFIPSIVVFLSIFFKQKKVLYTSLFFVILIFLAKGLNEPLKIINVYFYKLPFTFLFREPRNVLDVGLIIFSLLFAVGVDLLNKKIIVYKYLKIALSLVLVSTLFVNIYPFLKREFVLTGVNIDGNTSITQVPVPNYLNLIRQLIERDVKGNSMGNVMLLPYSNNYQVRHSNGLWATDELEKRSLAFTFVKEPSGYLFSKETKAGINNLFENVCNVANLKKANIQYVLNRKYVQNYKDVVVQFNEDILNKCPYLHLLYTDNDFSLYKSADSNQEIYAFTDPIQADGDVKPVNLKIGLDKEVDYFFPDTTSTSVAIKRISTIFGDIGFSDLQSGSLSQKFLSLDSATKKSFLSTDHGSELVVDSGQNSLSIAAVKKNSVKLNGADINTSSTVKIVEIPFDPSKNYYVSPRGELIPVKKSSSTTLGRADELESVGIYTENENVISNGSFEDGFWQKDVGDCNNKDTNGLLAQSFSYLEKTSGIRSLQLEATRHIACVSTRSVVSSTGEYILQFDYQSSNAKQAGFYLSFDNAEKTAISEKITITNQSWHTYLRKIIIPNGAKNLRLYFYSYSLDDKTNIVTRYDNVHLSQLVPVNVVQIPQLDHYQNIPAVINSGKNLFEYKDARYSFSNLFPNGSFESGLWQEKVGDCHRYDDNPRIDMLLNQQDKSDGDISLELQATRHNACTSIALPVKGAATYLLGFNYQSPNAKSASYYISFNDPLKSHLGGDLSVTSTSWQAFSERIVVPDGATTITVYVYAKETDKKTTTINRYDNFKLIEIPDLRDAFYLVSEPKEKLVQPSSTQFELINPTKKLVHIKGATTSFFLGMSESYHDQWQLQLNNNRVKGWLNGWWPFAKPDRVGDAYHYQLDGFLNAWYVDVPTFCEVNQLCTKNADGSYDIEMVIEFWPQRWFYLGLLISGTTLALCLGYLGFYAGRSLYRRVQAKKQV